MERISRQKLYLEICGLIAQRGTCKRAQVGCVITQDNRIVSTGYNGSVIPHKHCSDLGCIVNDKCIHAVHAEANAICAAAKSGISLEGAVLYCTYAPCYECAKLIIQAGIIKVVYEKEYKTNPGIELLKLNTIDVIEYAE